MNLFAPTPAENWPKIKKPPIGAVFTDLHLLVIVAYSCPVSGGGGGAHATGVAVPGPIFSR